MLTVCAVAAGRDQHTSAQAAAAGGTCSPEGPGHLSSNLPRAAPGVWLMHHSAFSIMEQGIVCLMLPTIGGVACWYMALPACLSSMTAATRQLRFPAGMRVAMLLLLQVPKDKRPLADAVRMAVYESLQVGGLS
jgi:hypothetical protein